MKFKIFLFQFLLTVPLVGQTIDTSKTFELENFLQWVRVYHPVMQQAAILDDEARAELLQARGAFDPKLFADYEDKSFDQKNYFRIGEAGLKIPTWFGADLKVVHTWANGNFLNPANFLPEQGQAVLGLEVPLIRNLVFDQRRAQVQMAKVYAESNEARRRSIVNDLLLDAIERYWEWAYAYEARNIYAKGLELAENRFTIIKESFLQGDKPAIDTLESMIQIQDRQIQLEQARMDLQKARLELSNFLWYEELIPVEIPEKLKPQSLEDQTIIDDIQRLADPAILANHPDIRFLNAKQSQLEIKERLKREAFKPQLNIQYNLLADGLDFVPKTAVEPGISDLLRQNYKWGIKFSYPLIWRKERGGLQLVRLQQFENNTKIQHKRLEIVNKVRAADQGIRILDGQISNQRKAYQNQQRLLNAENEKFRIGESSVFLLNSREQKLIDTELKLVKLETKRQKLEKKLRWARGELR